MYLRKTSVISDQSNSYMNSTVVPAETVAEQTVRQYDMNQLFESGEKLDNEKLAKLKELIEASFDSIKDVKVGMGKPGSDGKVTADKCYEVLPNLELSHHLFCIANFYDSIQIGENAELNMENLLLKTSLNEYELYDRKHSQENENQNNEENLSREVIMYKKNGDFRFTQTQIENQRSFYVFSSNNEDKMTYIPIESKNSLIRQK